MSPVSGNRFRTRTMAPGVEAASAAFADMAFSPHRHDVYAIGVTAAGVQAFGYRGAVRHALPGDVFVLHPDELHDGRAGDDRGYAYRIVYLDPTLVFDALGGGPLPFVPDGVGDFPALRKAVGAMLAEKAGPAPALSAVDRLVDVADALTAAARGRPRRHPTIDRPAMAWARERLASTDAPPTLADLEDICSLSRYAISHQFKANAGTPPSRYATRRRLDRARALIAAGEPLAAAAAESGFGDQSHMTRCFRSAYGLSPAQWRRIEARSDEGSGTMKHDDQSTPL